MKPITKPKVISLTLGLLALLPLSVISSELNEVRINGFNMTIQGSSTLHDWESKVTQLDTGDSLALEGDKLDAGGNFEVQIPVKSIESHKDKMDRLTYEALKSEGHPNIHYRLESLTPLENNRYRSIGNLTIAGQTQQVEMDVQLTSGGNGEHVLTGSRKINMTHYGIEPPSLMFGTIKVGETVNVNFALTLTTN